ncbi:YqcI/YcgG family protein [Chryseobacterium fluminis]|uniref:guanitoxin biosynthesis heme-dependent pre-guanitoxin N-hydroxylase GntA n=1 Tax=Chryseobacterium fluminis TaxID=2983606 RepID=UPI00225BF9F6|nr:guanitoxin biosynthesis heme-dependent pre-guanitoxin N-hydroxylase GntA [Chryseobacterium sp. MMS21-Ot14]UZT99179.1 YqcI/YcgG family protein [Chryseobacterium sp. MMS21-Ot14]
MTPITSQPKNTFENDQGVIDEFKSFVDQVSFPCVAAKAALQKDQMKIFSAGHIACPRKDREILDFIHTFVDQYRTAENHFHTVCIIFPEATDLSEEMFDRFMWMRLQALSDLDAEMYPYDGRVNPDPQSDEFSFSLKEEAFFVIGLNPESSRPARRFKYPTLVFNPHAQFEELRALKRYDKMKNIVRKKDVALSGSINPMLNDFGDSSEVYQYSGLRYDHNWQCPFKYKNI